MKKRPGFQFLFWGQVYHDLISSNNTLSTTDSATSDSAMAEDQSFHIWPLGDSQVQTTAQAKEQFSIQS